MFKRSLVFIGIMVVAIAAYAGLIAQMTALTPALTSRVTGMTVTGDEGTFAVSDVVALPSTVSFTVTATGLAATTTATLSASVSHGDVIANIPTLTGTSNAASFTATGLPASVTPATTRTVVVPIADNGTAAMGLASIGSNGVITFYPTASISSTFTDTGTKTLTAVSVTYPK